MGEEKKEEKDKGEEGGKILGEEEKIKRRSRGR